MRSYLTKLGIYASQEGHQLVIVAPGPRDETEREGETLIERYAAPKMPYDSTYHMPLRVGRMKELVRRHAPDVLQVSSPFIPALVAPSLAKEFPGMLLAYVYHSDPIGCYAEPWATKSLPSNFRKPFLAPAWAFMRKVCASHDMTIVSGKWLKDDLTKKGCKNVENVDFGINHEDFAPEKAESRLRRQFLGELEALSDAKLVLIAGRLAADKRQARLVEAVRSLSLKRPLGLVVLGDGPERERLKAAAGDIPQAHFLKFTKDRAEYAAILATADVLLHGSICETYGFVLAETMASGTPLVAPDGGGARALAGPEYSELYPGLAGPDAIESALERLFDRSPTELSRAARAAGLAQPHTREHFQGLFSLYESRRSA